MFDYSLVHWTTFFAAVVLLELSPGADMAYMLGQTIRNGRKAGFAALFGSLAATYFHVAMAAIGLSAIIATSALAFTVIKWAGVIYLVWLGIQAFKSNGNSGATEVSKSKSTKTIFLQGALISMLNPKVALFFLAFLPQFVVVGAGPVSLQLLLHGTLLVVVGLLLQSPIIFMGARIASTLADNNRIKTLLDRCLGAIFVTLGIQLAMSKLE